MRINKSCLPFFSRTLVAGLIVAASVAFSGCNKGEPFAYVKVRGKICYEDGGRIPAGRIALKFIPQTPPVDTKTFPIPGLTEVDVKTGEFSVVSSHTYNDGLVRGSHKVIVAGAGDVVPPEYADVAKTPLVVSTDKVPFELKVRKPKK